MAGFTPDEGEILAQNVRYRRIHADRDANLELGLFTNVAPGEGITQAAITEPTGTGYARITLTDASWSEGVNPATYALQTFTVGAGGWTGSIQGYFVATKSAGGTKRLVHLEVDPNGPYTLVANDTYNVTLGDTAA